MADAKRRLVDEEGGNSTLGIAVQPPLRPLASSLSHWGWR